MAQKRMFAMTIVDSDAFLDMPLSAQALYFHLNMRADDDGFVGNPKKVMRTIGAADDDLKLLIAKRFLITFESGVIVIKHWRIHNTLSAGRYHETSYVSEKDMLKLKRNNAYTLNDGEEIDDEKLIEMGKRQVDEQKTNKRRTLDEQKTNSEIDKNKIREDKDNIYTPLTPQGEWNGENHTNVQNFDHLVETEMNEVKNTRLLETVKEWLMYKDGRKPRTSNHYQLQSIRSLTNKAFELAKECGTEAVVKLISDSIANNYQGITWDRLGKNSQSKTNSTFNNIESRNEADEYLKGLVDNE